MVECLLRCSELVTDVDAWYSQKRRWAHRTACRWHAILLVAFIHPALVVTLALFCSTNIFNTNRTAANSVQQRFPSEMIFMARVRVWTRTQFSYVNLRKCVSTKKIVFKNYFLLDILKEAFNYDTLKWEMWLKM